MVLKKNKLATKIVAMLMIVAMLLPLQANAAATEDGIVPYGSDYLDSYNSYVCPMGLGKIEVWFTVTADNYMDDLGALTVMLYESTDNSTWTWVKTFKHADYSDMLGHDDFYYSSHVDYSGVIGRYYKAYVTIWAGKDGGGDARYMWTLAKKATLFSST